MESQSNSRSDGGNETAVNETAKERISRKAAETILQKPVEVMAGGRRYIVEHPSVATLIMASEAISRLPDIRPDKDDVLKSSIALAPQCRTLGEVAAVLILGAREADRPDPSWRRRLFRRGPVPTKKEVLAKELMEGLTAGELYRAVAAILAKMEIGDFFALTTFLSEINLLRPTKVAAGTTGATASGR